VYNENDEIWLDGNFRNGNLWDGKVFSYGEDGLLRKVKIFKEGKFHSYSQF
jgi:antitoxin component YwqK of YwqJK toxin-antitoxin module